MITSRVPPSPTTKRWTWLTATPLASVFWCLVSKSMPVRPVRPRRSARHWCQRASAFVAPSKAGRNVLPYLGRAAENDESGQHRGQAAADRGLLDARRVRPCEPAEPPMEHVRSPLPPLGGQHDEATPLDEHESAGCHGVHRLTGSGRSPSVQSQRGSLRPGPAAAAAHLGGRSSQVKGRKENQEAETIFFPESSLDLGP